MGSTLAKAPEATERNPLSGIPLKPAKASLRPQEGGTKLREVAADAIHTTSSQKAAATDLDLSEGRLSHKLKDGSLTLAQLEELGPGYAAEFGRQLLEHFGPLSTPQTRVRQAIREIRRRCDEVEAFVDFIA